MDRITRDCEIWSATGTRPVAVWTHPQILLTKLNFRLKLSVRVEAIDFTEMRFSAP